MKNLLILALLATVVSLCNLTERLTNQNREGGNQSISNTGSNQANQNSSNESAATATPASSETTSEVSGNPVAGGNLAGKSLSLPKPAYPPLARAAKASGTVVVDVTVDETGKVTSANAQSGHPLLRQAAVQAAYASRFKPTLEEGKPVIVTGTITYVFKL